MCDCDNSKNVVDLQHVKIYIIMADYKVNEKHAGKSVIFSSNEGKSLKLCLDTANAEELAYAYEDFNSGDFIIKTEKSSEKKSSKKSISDKKGSKE